MAGRPKRRFQAPLGSGRARSLGPNDPRARRDGVARVEAVSSGENSDEIERLTEELAELRAELERQAQENGEG